MEYRGRGMGGGVHLIDHHEVLLAVNEAVDVVQSVVV